jgi:hypothetical protein
MTTLESWGKVIGDDALTTAIAFKNKGRTASAGSPPAARDSAQALGTRGLV